jgi:hypothetical protein
VLTSYCSLLLLSAVSRSTMAVFVMAGTL